MLQPTKIFLTCIITSCSCLFLGLLVAKPVEADVYVRTMEQCLPSVQANHDLNLTCYSDYASVYMTWVLFAATVYLLLFLYLVPTAKDILYQRFSKSEEQPVTFEEVVLVLLLISSVSMIVSITGKWHGFNCTYFIYSSQITVLGSKIPQVTIVSSYLLMANKWQDMVNNADRIVAKPRIYVGHKTLHIVYILVAILVAIVSGVNTLFLLNIQVKLMSTINAITFIVYSIIAAGGGLYYEIRITRFIERNLRLLHKQVDNVHALRGPKYNVQFTMRTSASIAMFLVVVLIMDQTLKAIHKWTTGWAFFYFNVITWTIFIFILLIHQSIKSIKLQKLRNRRIYVAAQQKRKKSHGKRRSSLAEIMGWKSQ